MFCFVENCRQAHTIVFVIWLFVSTGDLVLFVLGAAKKKRDNFTSEAGDVALLLW